MCFWCLQFLQKNEQKQVDLRLHFSKVEFVCLVFWRNVSLKKSFRLCLTFRLFLEFNTNYKCLSLQGTRINLFWFEVFFKVVILKQLLGSQILIAFASRVMFWWTISSGVLLKDEGRIEKREVTIYIIIQFLKWYLIFD